tara:strand:+ start:161 stop:616 length:456 start_codon:yes stop_codon:yes gene_type:complete
MNQDLKNDIYVIPDNLISKLQSGVKSLSTGEKGYDRCNTMISDGSLTHSQAKKFKSELENELVDNSYEVVGGDDMLSFINNSLEGRRDSVHRSKKIRQNSGEENVFKKTHTKDKTKNPTRVRKIKVATSMDDISNNRAVYEEINRIKQLIK